MESYYNTRRNWILSFETEQTSSEHKSIPFTTETMQQKFYWNASTEEAEEVLNGTYDSNEDAELTELMKLVLTNCVQISPPKKTNPEITVAQL